MKKSISIIAISLLATGCSLINNDPISFSKEGWENHISERHLMIDSLEDKYHLEGMTKEEIYDLLGETTTIDNDNIICYFINSSTPDQDYCLMFENNKVVDTAIKNPQ